MKILHLSFSRSGGAGIVGHNLAEAQIALGHEAKFSYVISKGLASELFSYPLLSLGAILDSVMVSTGKQKTLFSLFRDRASVHGNLDISLDTVVHLHWISGLFHEQFVRDLLDSGRRVVWTLHDMHPFTGGCHHSHDCNSFTKGCEECPQVRRIFEKRVSLNLATKTLQRHYENLRIVCPTDWIAREAKSGVVFRDQSVSVIPNPIAPVFTSQIDRTPSRQSLEIDEEDFVGIVVANNLLDPNKNVPWVVEAFSTAALGSSRPATLLVVGGRGAKLKSDVPRVLWLGDLEPEMLAVAFAASDIVLSGSIAESAGMTVVEGAALGIPSLSLSNSGTNEFVSKAQPILVAQNKVDFIQKLRAGMNKKLDLPGLGASLKQSSKASDSHSVAARYLALYESIPSRR